MELGSGLAVGIPSAAAILGTVPIVLRLLPQRNGAKYCPPLDECRNSFAEIKADLKETKIDVGKISQRFAWLEGALRPILKNGDGTQKD